MWWSSSSYSPLPLGEGLGVRVFISFPLTLTLSPEGRGDYTKDSSGRGVRGEGLRRIEGGCP
jgi:hypothetical protein